METISILIVEDDPIIGADLEDRLTDLGYQIFGPYESGEEALAEFEAIKPDLALLDIQLAGKWDGIETAHQLLKKKNLPIIFLTSNSDEATFAKAKQIRPAAFLSKPFRGRDLKHAIELAIVQSERNETATVVSNNTLEIGQPILLEDSLFVKNKDRLERVFLSDILWIEADDYCCRVHTKKATTLLTQTLSKIADKLAHQPHFFRTHRSYLVNLKHIDQIGELYLTIHSNQIPLSKTARTELLNKLTTV
jgi:DNA-binding LytR/AlgR family response regulator